MSTLPTQQSQKKMGVVVSSSAPTREQKKLHHIAEKIIAEDRKRNTNLFKLLLLGPGDSGKSTIVKQMRILHKNGFGREELMTQRSIVTWNIVHAMASILKAMQQFGIKLERDELEVDVRKILRIENEWEQNEGMLGYEDWTSMKKLWADAGVQASFARSNEYQLSDSTKYFCNSLDRISAPDYIPDEQDMLRIRVSTTAIVEIEFTLRGLTVNVIDVGGQRSQRKKWIHCFESVNGLIFVAAASEYNQMLVEDHRVNRMHESVKLFGTVINSPWFIKSHVVLFLNKKDLFAEKIRNYPLTIAFPDYQGSPDYEQAMAYLQDKFEKEKEDHKKMIYTHRTCATDTRNIEFVMDACFDIMLNKNMSRAGLY